MHKKGQTQVFITAVGTFAALAVFIIALSMTSQVIETNQATQSQTSVSLTVNESLSTNTTLAHVENKIPASIDNATAIVRNITGAGATTTILTRGTMYTLTNEGVFNITPVAAGVASGDWNVNITYNHTNFIETAAFNASAQGLAGATNVSNLIPTMGLIVGMVIVLSLLIGLAVFFRGRL